MTNMVEPIYLSIRAQTCFLSPRRCLFWEEKETLVVGGFQLGRFPDAPENQERHSSLDRLQEQILYFKAKRVLLIGGFPLPENNQYLEAFIQWRNRYRSLRTEIVLSRSNPVAETLLASLGVTIHPGMLEEEPFVWLEGRMASEKIKSISANRYFVSGYEDPGYKKYGSPRQMPGTPVFYFTPTDAKLPMFSKPKGENAVRPGKDELIWLVHTDHLEPKY